MTVDPTGRLPLIAAVLIVVVPLSGCLAGVGGPDEALTHADPAGTDVPAWVRDVLPHGDDHDHRDPDQHANRTTANFEVLGHTPLITDHHGRTSGDYFCGDTTERDGRWLSVATSFGTDVAVVVSDVSDPEDPRMIGELVMENTNVIDADLTRDGRYIVLGTHPYDSGPDRLPGQDATVDDRPSVSFRDACTGKERAVTGLPGQAPYASGVVLVDLQDPEQPAIVDYVPLPTQGAHSVFVDRVKGRSLAIATTSNSPNRAANYYAFLEVADTPAGAKLELLSTYQYGRTDLDEAQDHTEYGAPHDGYVQEHPVTGRALAYLAYGATGLVIVDVEDPTQPKLVSLWDDWGRIQDGFDPSGASAFPFLHSVLPTETTWDGRHVTFVGEECLTHPKNTPTCLVLSFDTTDPADPQWLGAWTLPVDVPWEKQLEYSVHYMDVVDRTLFVTLYHGGLWAVDVSTDEALEEMPSIGAFLPAEVSPKPPGDIERGVILDNIISGYALEHTPIVLDVTHRSDGTMIVHDTTSGQYTVRFDPTRPMPSPDPWPIGDG